MKKSILIGAIAALMLFAFVACDNGSSVGYVLDVAASGKGETIYLPGETVDPSEFTYTLFMYDGSTQTASASDFVFDDLTADGSTINGYYKGNKAWDVTINPMVATVKSITVDATAADVEKTYYATASTEDKYTNDLINLNGVVITAKYEYTDADGVKTEGEKAVAIDNPSVNATIADWATASTTAGDKSVTVSYGGDSKSYAVTLVQNLVQSVAVKTTADYVVYDDDTTFKAAAFSGETVTSQGIYLEATYVNGEVAPVAAADVKFSNDGGNSYQVAVSAISVPESATYTVRAKYTGDDGVVGITREVTAPITIVENKVTGITASIAAGTLKMDDYTSKMPVGLVVTTVKTHGAGEELGYGEGYTVSAADGLKFTTEEGYEAGDRVAFTVTATATGHTANVEVVLTSN